MEEQDPAEEDAAAVIATVAGYGVLPVQLLFLPHPLGGRGGFLGRNCEVLDCWAP